MSLKKEINRTERDIRYDLLRIIASFMVVFLHVSATEWYTTPPQSFDWLVMNFYDSFVRSAVPLFFMLSGAFMFKKEVNIKRLYFGKIIPLIFVYIVWAVLYAVDIFNISGLKAVPLKTLFLTIIKGYYHMWFIPVLIGIYVLQPFLYAFVNFENGKFIKYYLVVFFVAGILKSTFLEPFKGVELAVLILGKIPFEAVSYLGYVVLGHYLANNTKRKMKPLISALIFIVTVIISTAVCQIVALKTGKPSDLLYDNFMLPVFIESVVLFLLFKNADFGFITSVKIKSFISKLASLTLGVYLLHPFIIEQLSKKLGFDVLSFSPIASIPIVSIITALICLVITYIALKIPFINKVFKL